jgi:hypothetical protein
MTFAGFSGFYGLYSHGFAGLGGQDRARRGFDVVF